jgi:hypothetical protein
VSFELEAPQHTLHRAGVHPKVEQLKPQSATIEMRAAGDRHVMPGIGTGHSNGVGRPRSAILLRDRKGMRLAMAEMPVNPAEPRLQTTETQKAAEERP